jgi:hypothetical protein
MDLKGGPGWVATGTGSSDPGNPSTATDAQSRAEELVGKRVQIQAIKTLGSARLLHGLTGTVVALHPIASGWVKLELDENSRTPHRDWSVAVDRLITIDPNGPDKDLV